MKRWNFFLIPVLLVFLLSSPLLAKVILNNLSGNVEVFQTRTGGWIQGRKGMTLCREDKIRTSANGKAELAFVDGTKIWLKENTELELVKLLEEEEADGIITHLKLLFGKIRAKVAPLPPRASFKAETPSAVMAVRGTEFLAIYEGRENRLIVLEGKVNLTSLFSQQTILVGAGQVSLVGNTGAIVPPRPINRDEKRWIKEEWKNIRFLNKEEGGEKSPARDQKRDSLRKELRNFIRRAKYDIRRSIEVTTEIQESDFSTGRTLLDVHKNLVRVEQHVRRPDRKSLQFINLTKRNDYRYRGKFRYAGPATARLDVMEVKLTFNRQLPEQISEWPKFFVTNSDVKPENLYMLIKNNHGDKLEWKGHRVTTAANKEEMEMDFYVNDKKTYEVADSILNKSEYNVVSGEKNGQLWMHKSTPVNFNPLDKEHVDDVLQLEFYGIDNDGNILSLDYFTESKEIDPFNLLKKSAGEGIISFKEDEFKNRNIDLVVTPDIAIPVLRNLVTSGEFSISDTD